MKNIFSWQVWPAKNTMLGCVVVPFKQVSLTKKNVSCKKMLSLKNCVIKKRIEILENEFKLIAEHGVT